MNTTKRFSSLNSYSNREDGHRSGTVGEIPTVCFLDDLARVLRISRTTIKCLRRCRTFPIPEVPSLDKRPRWSGEVVRRFIENGETKIRRRGGRW